MFNKVQIKTILILSLVFATFSVMGQEANISLPIDKDKVESAELILGFPKASDKTIDWIIGKIDETNGLKYQYYCEQHKLVLVKYNKKLYATEQNVVDALSRTNLNMPIFIKEGTFESVMEMCEK